jgi:hypothetical protein
MMVLLQNQNQNHATTNSQDENKLLKRRRRAVHFDVDGGDASTSTSSTSTTSTSSSTRTTSSSTSMPAKAAPSLRLFQTLTLETCQELWYQPKEIAVFKAITRQLILYGKATLSQGGSGQEEDGLDGLERFNLERSKHKKTSIHCVILAQQQQKGPDFLKIISKKCTRRANDLAVMQGFQDFIQAYDPLESLLGSNAAVQNYNDYFFNEQEEGNNHHNKRAHEDDNDDDVYVEEDAFGDRRVRQRRLANEVVLTPAAIPTSLVK